MKYWFVFSLFISFISNGKDIYHVKNKKNEIVAVITNNAEIIKKPLKLQGDKLTNTFDHSLVKLNEYYGYAYKDQQMKILSIFNQRDGSWKNLNTKILAGKRVFKNFYKLETVDTLEKYAWGDYWVYKVRWGKKDKFFNWLDTVECTGDRCFYSDLLLRFDDYGSSISGILSRSKILPFDVNKEKFNRFDLFPKGSNKNPISFYYSFHKLTEVITQGKSSKENAIIQSVQSYYSALKKIDFSVSKGMHEAVAQSLGVKYWNNFDSEKWLSVYTQEGESVSIKRYSFAALNQKLYKYKEIESIGYIESSKNYYVLLNGVLLNGTKEVFFMPITKGGLLTSNVNGDIVWDVLTMPEFASNIITKYSKN